VDAGSAAAADLGGADAVVGIVVADFDFEFAVAIVAAVGIAADESVEEVAMVAVRVVVDIAAEVAGVCPVVGDALLESHAADDVAAVHSVSAVLPLGGSCCDDSADASCCRGFLLFRPRWRRGGW